MLRFLYLTAALSTALIPFLPDVAFGLPLDINAGNSSTVVGYPLSNPNVVIAPGYGYSTAVPYPGYNSTIIVDPGYNSYSPRTPYTINNFGTVIIQPRNNSPISQHSHCGTAVIGNPIPSPVPVDLYTGRFCQ